MLNPFINYLPPKKAREDFRSSNENEIHASYEKKTIDAPASRPLILWFGTLLIKMGEKMTKENLRTKSSHGNA